MLNQPVVAMPLPWAQEGGLMHLKDVLGSQQAMDKILTASLPAKVAFRLARLVTDLRGVLAAYEETRFKLIKKYGSEDPAKEGVLTVLPERMPEFLAELNPLLEEPVAVTVPPLTLEDLAAVQLTPMEALQLGWLLAPEPIDGAAIPS